MAVHWGGRGPGHMSRWPLAPGFNPLSLFAAGEKGVILLPENSDVGVGSGVGTVTDTSGNGKNATQGTAANKPILRQNATTGALYWEFDGSDDWLQSAAIDLTATDKVTVFTALRKLSDSAFASCVEFSADLNSNAGSFGLAAPSTAAANFSFRSKGTSIAGATQAGYASPISAVITGTGNISGDSAVLRVNGAVVSTSAADQGTGNYGNHAAYIGRRGGSSAPFNGHLYGLMVVGRVCTAAEISATEAFFNRRIGAF